jgi:hypothetical protein
MMKMRRKRRRRRRKRGDEEEGGMTTTNDDNDGAAIDYIPKYHNTKSPFSFRTVTWQTVSSLHYALLCVVTFSSPTLERCWRGSQLQRLFPPSQVSDLKL